MQSDGWTFSVIFPLVIVTVLGFAVFGLGGITFAALVYGYGYLNGFHEHRIICIREEVRRGIKS